MLQSLENLLMPTVFTQLSQIHLSLWNHLSFDDPSHTVFYQSSPLCFYTVKSILKYNVRDFNVKVTLLMSVNDGTLLAAH